MSAGPPPGGGPPPRGGAGPPPGGAPPPPAPRPAGWRRAIRYGWLVLALGAVAVVLARRWDEVRPELAGADPRWLVLAALLAAAGVGCSALVWRSLLRGLGARLSLAASARVFFVGQLGKYLPGSVWPLVAQAELGRDYALAPRASVAGVVLFMWAHLVTGVAAAALALPAAGVAPPAVALVALPALALLAPGLISRVLSAALRLARRAPLAALPDRVAILRAAAWAALMWALYGGHLAAVTAALDHPGRLLLATGAFAAAWCAGFVFVVAPAGAGVREAAMVGLLLAALPTGAALAVTLLSRLLVTAADVAWGVAGLSLRRPRAGSRP